MIELNQSSSDINLQLQPGINTGLWGKDVLSPKHVKLAAEAGFKALEISPYSNTAHFDFQSKEQIQMLNQAADDYGVAIWSLHSRDVGDLTVKDLAKRQPQLDHLRYCLDAADQLGARAVVSHLQALGKNFDNLPEAEKQLAEGMKELEPRAEKSCARIAIENGYAFHDGQWTRDIIKRVDPFSPSAFGYVIDTGHAHIAGDMNDIESGINERLISLHLNDNDGKHDIHLPPGQGTVDWQRVASWLKGANYDGCLMWEIGIISRDPTPQDLTRTMEGHHKLVSYLE